ncbi:Hsp70 family protein [Tuwongella immobilis]|uniref:Nucleotide-binding protein n=1 Tax=Tuwongella immobilis TaxID=692036 RepID=A0A6C2YHL0_9BACT|nr:Hsp70 family protein [Tuwongella immobilis]VIP00749.1 heat shock protein 70 family protein : Molecular chaperone OS=Singulisphaera acidiphila (strain ATCC BAA-1392 / DSM 18658 / VKM B-2454 / MOB10) GN=Sinac_2984 PE=3 SV=1: HSP70 [Tuwongella immobilis]VTR96916.1 heat shock protein 70 family protein : Molecular chaperone OS=Singulisphaera acidiphila (strain ATCC BAA-1392 / DSM 18658 / VKM B-2454 / MOB10) GN=Sinac_2984 PE=3 SV=1: HSP70 [Tuwongella immobilis]
MASRYVVGIDLGTTNTALAYVDTQLGESARCQDLPIPQVVQPGQVDSRPLLPSFLMLPNASDLPAGSLDLPWAKGRDFAVGEFARNRGAQVPTQLVASAKSWLGHAGVDRKSPILPWKSPEGVRKISPLDASTRYLQHLADVWNHTIAANSPADRLQLQDIVLTVPASFDAAARELTIEAARAAGFEHLTILEEPQAAFYAWLNQGGDGWRKQVKPNDLILVADIGGGTSDFTLIEVEDDRGELRLTRLAVGDHLLLGGDNMDLALAYAVGTKLPGVKLDGTQLSNLSHSCRLAKETLFRDPSKSSAPVTVLGRGSRVIGGTIKAELTRDVLDSTLLNGFFPPCGLESLPQRRAAAGFQEIGLPYVAEPAITKQLAHFLSRQQESLAMRATGGRASALPTAILFNGGVFQANPLRERLLAVMDDWATQAKAPKVRTLTGEHLDLAVARGAAVYGLVRRGSGIRIRGGTARAYYVGIETAAPAIPGMSPPIKAFCVAPFGMEEGTETDVPGPEFGLMVGEPVEFRFLGSSTRRQDRPGTLVDDWTDDEIEELAPITTVLHGSAGERVPVRLHSRITEVGQLELSCQSRTGERWKLEFNVRESTDATP